MKTAIAKRWVKALKSGKYKQGKQYLRKGDKYCCLGVLCDLYLIDNDKKWEPEPLYDRGYMCEEGYGNLPPEVMEWAGLPDATSVSDQVVMHHREEGDTYDEVITLVEANDREGYDFEQIAKLIETEFLPKERE